MIIVRLIEFLRRHLKAVVRLCWILLALLVLSDWFFVGKEHAHTSMERVFGFWSLFGFVSCMVIIFFSKWYGHLGIMKREDYYGDD
jgi:hypothetical protein